MSHPASSLPPRPSLEQLHKQAKDLLKQCRSGNSDAIERFRAVKPRANEIDPPNPPTLADAQFVLAREYGFDTWAKLKHHVNSLTPNGMEHFERLALDLAEAYSAGDLTKIRKINWDYGTSFVWEHEPRAMQQRLVTWFGSENRTPELALADAKNLVAHSYGFDTWNQFVASTTAPPAEPRSAPFFISSTPPFYKIDWNENLLSVRGPQSKTDWESIVAVIEEHRIAKLDAPGITDDAMSLLPRLDHLTSLNIGGKFLTDVGVWNLDRMTQLQDLEIGGPTSTITDRGLEPLKYVTHLRRFKSCWTPGISDTGLANLGACPQLEEVNLMGTFAGDGTIRALAGKSHLRQFSTGRSVTDAGLDLLHEFPVFKTWQGGEPTFGLMSADAGPNRLLIDGPFTNAGLATLGGLDGLFGLTFFWHCPAFTSDGLVSLSQLPNLGYLGCQDQHCDDTAMQHISALPNLRMLMGQGAVATDSGFEALSRSKSIQYFWGRECPHLTSRGFAAFSKMPSLQGLATSLKNVDDLALSTLPDFPSLRELMPMDLTDAGFRHIGRCQNLQGLWCMYCRDTGDAATEHLSRLAHLKTYYAGLTKITDHSLEILSRIASLENLEFWQCTALTDIGIAHLSKLPKLRKISLDGLPNVSRKAISLFPASVRVSYSG